MEEEHKKRIEELAGQLKLKCEKNFRCCKYGTETLCKAKLIGNTGFVECGPPTDACSDKDRLSCKFRLSFGDKFLCDCPIRTYIAENLNGSD